MLAPVVLFVYNRPHHTRQTLAALAANKEAAETDLHIFADGPKENATDKDRLAIEEVRKVIHEVKGFKHVSIYEKDKNAGLAPSIISGVTEIINQYDRVIVLEDDIVCSPHFLKYMNHALSKYDEDDQAKQITGYFPDVPSGKQHTAGFIPVTSTWSWATWKRVWDQVNFAPTDYVLLKQDKALRSAFNLNDRYDYAQMLEMQMESNKISSWGILFWWDAFKKKGLILYPDFSFVSNIGFDGSGTHYTSVSDSAAILVDSSYEVSTFPDIVKADTSLYEIFLSQFTVKKKSRGFFSSLMNKIKN